MKGTDKAIVLGVVMAVVLAAFYFKVLSPKREKASSLSQDITAVKSKIDEQKQAATFGEQARQDFPRYYGQLVVLGKAVPGQADTSSLLVELNAVASRTGVDFRGIELSAGSSSAGSSSTSTSTSSSSTSGSTSTTGDTSTTSATPSGSDSGSSSTSTATSAAPTPATESGAANLPLGAVVGTAGLPTMPYDLTFEGSYFDVANFLKSIDSLVHARGTGMVAADGRLMTINGFALTPSPSSPAGAANPKLQVSVSVTSYITPSDQGLTAGASPSGPAPSLTQPQTQPASSTVSP